MPSLTIYKVKDMDLILGKITSQNYVESRAVNRQKSSSIKNEAGKGFMKDFLQR